MSITKVLFSKFTLLTIATIYCINLGAQHSEYYRHLVFRETPYSDIRGNHSIGRLTAQNEAHYKFVYDEDGRLIEVSHRIGDDLIADNGNWDSFIWFAPKVEISYSGSHEIHYYYNHLDEKSEVHGKVFKAVFALNKNGQRLSLKFYDRVGDPSLNTWGIHHYQWTPLEDGIVIEKRFDLEENPQTIRPDFTFYTVKMEFDNDGLLDFIYHIDETGNIINNSMKAGLDRIVYDQEDNFSRWMVFDKDFNPVEGNAPEFAIGEHLYDCRGNKVELRGFDVRGRAKAMPNGVARVVNKYDLFNNQIEVRTYNLDGMLLQHAQRIFSEDGRRVKWIKFLDVDGNLTMHNSGQFAAIEFVYDKNGVAIQKFYDGEMNELKG